MADVSADGFLSAAKSVLESYHIEKFRETHQNAILNLLKRKDVSRPTVSEKHWIDALNVGFIKTSFDHASASMFHTYNNCVIPSAV